MALILQNFDLNLDDPNYQIHIQQSLTIKPKDCYVHAKLRSGITAMGLQNRLSGTTEVPDVKNAVPAAAGEPGTAPLTILYGSNTGTCQALAQKLASEAAQHGCKPTVLDMDSGAIPTDRPLVIITASYEGEPPDNAARFVAMLESQKGPDAFKGAKFAVFGCGHVDWASTYMRIPKLVDDILGSHGADRIAEIGFSDVSKRDTFGDFGKWTSEALWPALSGHIGKSGAVTTRPAMPYVEAELSTQQRASHLQQRLYWANVTAVKTLTTPGQSEKRHVEFQLPSDMEYQAGDYLAVLPLNPDETVRRVIKRFDLPWDAVITIKKGDLTTLPTEAPISVQELLKGYVELTQPATRDVSWSSTQATCLINVLQLLNISSPRTSNSSSTAPQTRQRRSS